MVHDDELLARFAAGDAEAFVGFYRRHLSAILGFFLRRTGDPELTADLTAEVRSDSPGTDVAAARSDSRVPTSLRLPPVRRRVYQR